jgi:hypothetical protein
LNIKLIAILRLLAINIESNLLKYESAKDNAYGKKKILASINPVSTDM